jgi:general stress protein 26
MNAAALAKLRSLLGDARICMLTTEDGQGDLRSRPMALQQADFDGDLWFFAGRHSELGSEIARNERVNIALARTDHHVYVSISGRAQFVDDPAKAKRLWSVYYKAWFPKGLDDPDLQLMKVAVDKAEYWDSPNSAVIIVYAAVKATLTGEQQPTGEHGKFAV